MKSYQWGFVRSHGPVKWRTYKKWRTRERQAARKFEVRLNGRHDLCTWIAQAILSLDCHNHTIVMVHTTIAPATFEAVISVHGVSDNG